MRYGVIAALLVSAAPAWGNPRSTLEASGFLGVDYFGDDIGLGGSPAPEQRPQTAPTFGGRITWLPLQIGGDIHLDIGVEAELAFTPSWTGYGFSEARPSVFAPVFGFHGNVMLRLGGGWLQPHITAGGGGETVASSSMYMAKETDPVFLWGVGASFPMAGGWQLRFDARQGVMEAIDGGTTQTYEAHVSIGRRLGVASTKREPARVEVVQATPVPPEPPRDSDGDGVLGALDKCPARPELVNGVQDDDGCPEDDSDGDGLVDAADACPARAEDMDGFQDDDGCVDEDNDADGIVDARDKCPLEPENKNGIADDDGCADQIPAEITTAFAASSKVAFERNRARLTTASKTALDKALLAMLNHPRMKVTLTVHPEKADETATQLATKRADAVKWYLVEQGAAAANLTIVVGAPLAGKKAPIIELAVTP